MWFGSHEAASRSFMRWEPKAPSLRANTKPGGTLADHPLTADSLGNR